MNRLANQNKYDRLLSWGCHFATLSEPFTNVFLCRQKGIGFLSKVR